MINSLLRSITRRTQSIFLKIEKTSLYKLRMVFLGIIILASSGAFAQVPITFEEIIPPQISADFEGVREGSVAYADVDGDLDLDVLITGRNNSNQPIAKLYNNEDGIFTEVEGTNFEGVFLSSVAFADVDGDMDPDLLITGRNSASQPTSKLYKNEGGVFTEFTSAAFENVYGGSIAFGDVDGDLDPDVVITGYNGSENITKLYINNSGVFSEVAGTIFDGVSSSFIAFADVDGDTDLDVLITGENNSDEHIAKLYINDAGVFSEVAGTPFEGVAEGSVAFEDIDGDLDADVIITGKTQANLKIAKIYTNNSGIFSEVNGTPFEGISSGQVAFADVDGDLDQDLIISGSNNSNQFITKYYKNNSGTFSEVADSIFENMVFSTINFADVDGDMDQDVLLTGLNDEFVNVSKLYINDGTGNFSVETKAGLDGVDTGSVAFADIDGDLDADLLITGLKGQFAPITKLYVNDGNGNYTEKTQTVLEDVYSSSVAFADIDGDLDNDLLITGLNNFNQRATKLYTNDGTGTFTEITTAPFEDVSSGSVAFADIDGDMDLDVIIAGNSVSRPITTKLYKNDGAGNFTLVSGTSLEGVYYSDIEFADVDADTDLDVLITGTGTGNQSISKLYINDGSGNFSENTNVPFEGVKLGAIAFGDVNGDTNPDVMITGINDADENISKLYINDGAGNFTEDTSIPFEGVNFSSVAFEDLDGDLDMDLLITGKTNADQKISKLYSNDGTGVFTEITGLPFEAVSFGSVAFEDVDGDSNPDLVITGSNSTINPIAKLYRNITLTINYPPIAICKDFTAQLDATGSVIITGEDVDGGSSDPNGDSLTLSVSPDTFDCSAVGTPQTVTLTIDDGNGKTATCTATVTIEDTEDPVLATCLSDITQNTDANSCDAIVSFNLPSATDNCDATVSASPESGSIFEIGTTEVTITATDSAGNTDICTFNVVIDDNEDPVFDSSSLPTDQERVANASGEYPLDDFTVGITASDNCTDASAITFMQDPTIGTILTIGTYNITLSAADANGNNVDYSFELEVTELLGVNSPTTILETIALYPNPASSYITISNPKNIELNSVVLFDISGRVVLQKSLMKMNSEDRLNLGGLPSGIYMVVISSGQQQLIKRLIKK